LYFSRCPIKWLQVQQEASVPIFRVPRVRCLRFQHCSGSYLANGQHWVLTAQRQSTQHFLQGDARAGDTDSGEQAAQQQRDIRPSVYGRLSREIWNKKWTWAWPKHLIQHFLQTHTDTLRSRRNKPRLIGDTA